MSVFPPFFFCYPSDEAPEGEISPRHSDGSPNPEGESVRGGGLAGELMPQDRKQAPTEVQGGKNKKKAKGIPMDAHLSEKQRQDDKLAQGLDPIGMSQLIILKIDECPTANLM